MDGLSMNKIAPKINGLRYVIQNFLKKILVVMVKISQRNVIE